MIPNFVGADTAAWHLAQTDGVEAARRRSRPIRTRRRSRSGCGRSTRARLVFAPVPYLTAEFPLPPARPREAEGRRASASSWPPRRRASSSMATASSSTRSRRSISASAARWRSPAPAAAPARAPASPISRPAIFRELGIVTADNADGNHGAFEPTRRRCPRADAEPRLTARFRRDRKRTDPHRQHRDPPDGRRLGQGTARPVRDHPVPDAPARRDAERAGSPPDGDRRARGAGRSRGRVRPLRGGAGRPTTSRCSTSCSLAAPTTIRYGMGENLYGIDAIRAYRAGAPVGRAAAPARATP